MNTKSLLTRIAVPVLSLGLLGGIGATLATSASPASAATMASATHATTVTGITFQGHVEDTTDHATAVTDPVYGPVWSYDDMARSLAARSRTRPTRRCGTSRSSSTACTTRSLTRASDNTAYHSSGLMTGWVTYDVHSATAPSQAHLPLTVPSTCTRRTSLPSGSATRPDSRSPPFTTTSTTTGCPAASTTSRADSKEDHDGAGRCGTARLCHARGKAPCRLARCDSGAWAADSAHPVRLAPGRDIRLTA